MPDYKSNHYVSEFYLRNFSPNQKSVGLYNLKTDFSYGHASIKDQCCKDYLYGKDGQAEKALRDIETASSAIIREIISTHKLPPLFSAEHIALMIFVLIQNARTLNATDELNEVTDKVIKHLFVRYKRGQIKQQDLDRVKLQYDNAALQRISHAVEVYPLILDLVLFLLVNNTGRRFITSDNPVVLYNQYLDERDYSGNTGLQSIGLQICFPLSPKLLLVCYDSSVYSIHPRLSESDIENINGLQFLNAFEHMYYHSEMTDLQSFSDAFKKIHGKRLRKTNIHSQIKQQPNNPERELFGLYRDDIKADLQLSFIAIKPSAMRTKADVMSRIAVRDPHLCNELRYFRELVKNDIYCRGEFPRYLSDNAKGRIGGCLDNCDT